MSTAPLVARQPLLSAEAIGVDFDGRTVLDGVSLQLYRGDIVTLIGPNGAGKSTLVRVLLGLLPAQRGRVWQAPGCRIGYVPQRLQIDPILPLTVARFLTLGIAAPQRRLQALLDEVGAGQLLMATVSTLSGGELQRVLLARALLREPDLLFLDEPVQGVDVTGQSELYALIGDLRQRYHCAILMVSHDLHLVMAATDEVICLNHTVCCSGHPERVLIDPAYRRLFPLAPAGLALYTHHHDGLCDSCHLREPIGDN